MLARNSQDSPRVRTQCLLSLHSPLTCPPLDQLQADNVDAPTALGTTTDIANAIAASEAKSRHFASTQHHMSVGSGPLSDEDHQVWLENLAGSYEVYNEGDWEGEIQYAQNHEVRHFMALMDRELGSGQTPLYDSRELIDTAQAHLEIHRNRQDAPATADSADLTAWGWLVDDDETPVPENSAPLPVYEYSLEDRSKPPPPDVLGLDPDLVRQMLAAVIVGPLARNDQAYKQYEVRS